MLHRLLVAAGYHVIASQPGSDAMDKAQMLRPDLILAALSLPGQPAWETVRQLRAAVSLAQTPILGTTVYSALLSIARVKAAGLEGYVEKPFDIDDLLGRIHQMIGDPPRPALSA